MTLVGHCSSWAASNNALTSFAKTSNRDQQSSEIGSARKESDRVINRKNSCHKTLHIHFRL